MFITCIILGCMLILFPAGYLLLITPNRPRREEIAPFLGRDYAHRGLHDLSRGIPENSMSAFREALRQNLAVELDIHLTRDKQVVVFHDDSLQRICGVEGTVEASTYEELQRLHLSGTDQRIPLFTEVLDALDGRIPLLIELKLPDRSTELCRYAWEILQNYKGAYMIQSFNSLGVRWFRIHAPQVLRGQLASALTRTNPGSPYAARFCAEHLLTNLYCRPDFISYKFADAQNLSLRLLRRLYHTPVAVWTLRNNRVYKKAHKTYDMFIFEGFTRKI